METKAPRALGRPKIKWDDDIQKHIKYMELATWVSTVQD